MMKKWNVLSLFVLFSVNCLAQKKEEKLVIQSFDNYKSALLAGDAEKAVEYVDCRTIKFYEEILELTKFADSAEVNRLSLMDKVLVLSVRHRASRQEIVSFDGKSLLVFAMKEGMVARNSVDNNSIGNLEIDGDYARGQLLSYGKKTPIYYDFHKDAGLWKIDLTSVYIVSSRAIKEMVEESGDTENDFLFIFLEVVTGVKPEAAIWEPVY